MESIIDDMAQDEKIDEKSKPAKDISSDKQNKMKSKPKK